MRKRNMLSTILGFIVLAVLAAGGYVFFKDLDGPQVVVQPQTGRVSPASVIKIAMKDASGIRAVTVGVRKNNTLNTIFSKHFEKYLPERTVEVPLAGANQRARAL